MSIGALVGILPTGAALPLAPYTAFFDNPPIFGVLVLLSAFVLGWLVARRHLVQVEPVAPDERLAGFVVALTTLGVVAIGLAVLQPYALVFVLPSLYAWLWLPLDARPAVRASVFAVGLLGPIAGLLLLGNELGLSVLDAALYVIGLFTVGYLPLGSALLGIVWAAAATQLGAIAVGRYAPHAAGMEPPPAGPIRRVLARAR